MHSLATVDAATRSWAHMPTMPNQAETCTGMPTRRTATSTAHPACSSMPSKTLTAIEQGVCSREAAALRHAGWHAQCQHARTLASLLLMANDGQAAWKNGQAAYPRMRPVGSSGVWAFGQNTSHMCATQRSTEVEAATQALTSTSSGNAAPTMSVLPPATTMVCVAGTSSVAAMAAISCGVSLPARSAAVMI